MDVSDRFCLGPLFIPPRIMRVVRCHRTRESEPDKYKRTYIQRSVFLLRTEFMVILQSVESPYRTSCAHTHAFTFYLL